MDNPRARRNDLFSERLGDETVIYDKLNHRAHTLNRTVATVWELADGDQSVNELADIFHATLGIPADSWRCAFGAGTVGGSRTAGNAGSKWNRHGASFAARGGAQACAGGSFGFPGSAGCFCSGAHTRHGRQLGPSL